MRRTIRKVLSSFGYDLTRKPRPVLYRKAELLPSLSLLAGYLNSHKSRIQFVQVGAYDGCSNDPLLAAAERYQWSGVCVEPQKRAFEKLSEVHKNNSRVELKNVAIGPENEERVLFTLKVDDRLPDWAYQLSSFDRDHILKHQKMLRVKPLISLVQEEVVKCITFDQLLKDCSIDHVDVLQIDTEGYDFEILKLFQISKRLPAIVNFEHVHLSKSDWNSAADLLIDAGYQLAVSGWDTIALHRGEFETAMAIES